MALRAAAPRLATISRATHASSSKPIIPTITRTIVLLSTTTTTATSQRNLASPRITLSRRSATFAAAPTPLAASPAPPPPFSSSGTSTRIRVTPPSLEAIKEEGYMDEDVQLLSAEEATLNITPEAVRQLINITSRESPELLEKNKLALRVGVESGGCHGYQYTMAITEDRGVDDYVLQPETEAKCIPVVVDLISFGLLKGSTLHHATELIGSSFRVQDNPQAKEGGACGCGVSWEAKA